MSGQQGTAPTPVDARVAINGKKWCYGKFLDQSTTEIISDDETNCGHVDPEVEGELSGRELNRFSILLNPTMPMLFDLIPFWGTDGQQGSGSGAVSGLAGSGAGTYSGIHYASLDLKSVSVTVDKIGAIHHWERAWINRVILRGQGGTQPVQLEMQFIAIAETEAGSWTAAEGDMDWIFPFPGNTLTYGGQAYDIDRFAFVIDRNLVPEFEGSVYMTDIGRGHRETMLATSHPYRPTGGYKDLYWNNKRSDTPVSVALRLTNGYRNIDITIPKAKALVKSPSMGESIMETIRLPMTWRARRELSSGNDAFNIRLAHV